MIFQQKLRLNGQEIHDLLKQMDLHFFINISNFKPRARCMIVSQIAAFIPSFHTFVSFGYDVLSFSGLAIILVDKVGVVFNKTKQLLLYFLHEGIRKTRCYVF